MGTVLAVLVVLLLVVNHGFLAVARGFSNLPKFDSSRNVSNCNVTLEDKRGVPTGANPLHNR